MFVISDAEANVTSTVRYELDTTKLDVSAKILVNCIMNTFNEYNNDKQVKSSFLVITNKSKYFEALKPYLKPYTLTIK
jgi:hypothetical protein